MPVDEITREHADGLNDAREAIEELSGRRRYFLLQAAPVNALGLRPIAVAGDPSGEISDGLFAYESTDDAGLVVRIAEVGGVGGATREHLQKLWGIAALVEGAPAATVFKRGRRVRAPNGPANLVWNFVLELTAQAFAPANYLDMELPIAL